MLAVGLIGIFIGIVFGWRLAVGALIPVMLVAVLGAGLTALTGRVGDAAVGFVVFSMAVQLACVAAATLRTASRRKQPYISARANVSEAELAAFRAQP
jgi:hypothetical protein